MRYTCLAAHFALAARALECVFVARVKMKTMTNGGRRTHNFLSPARRNTVPGRAENFVGQEEFGMWVNPRTGKGWNDEEEAAFAALQEAGRLKRLEAIRLYRRMGCDLAKALKYARQMSDGRSANRERAKERVKRASPVEETAQG